MSIAFKIDKKTGFKTLTDVICIYRNGEPFYAISRSNTVNFNLPAGKYELLQGDISQLSQPVKYSTLPLDKPERKLKFSGKLDIKYATNPHKCTVYLYDKHKTHIVFDNNFKYKPWFVKIWVMGHELAHHFYGGHGQKSEQNCDHYSANMMLQMGYNPTQIDAAIEQAISNGYHARKRKDLLYDNLIKIKRY